MSSEPQTYSRMDQQDMEGGMPFWDTLFPTTDSPDAHRYPSVEFVDSTHNQSFYATYKQAFDTFEDNNQTFNTTQTRAPVTNFSLSAVNNADRNESINESNGLINESNGLINESNGLINESNGLINESNGLINESNGLINESNGLINHQYSNYSIQTQQSAVSFLDLDLEMFGQVQQDPTWVEQSVDILSICSQVLKEESSAPMIYSNPPLPDSSRLGSAVFYSNPSSLPESAGQGSTVVYSTLHSVNVQPTEEVLTQDDILMDIRSAVHEFERSNTGTPESDVDVVNGLDQSTQPIHRNPTTNGGKGALHIKHNTQDSTDPDYRPDSTESSASVDSSIYHQPIGVRGDSAAEKKRPTQTRKKDPLKMIDRKERKKAQNRKAASRYRTKKRSLMEIQTDELTVEEQRYKLLKAEVEDKEYEVAYLRRLVEDVKAAKAK